MKVLHLGLILVTLLTLGNLRTRADQQKQNNDPSTKEGLQISLISPKVRYRRSEKIKLHVMLNNITSKNIYVLGSLGWGYNASLLLHVRDASGKESNTSRSGATKTVQYSLIWFGSRSFPSSTSAFGVSYKLTVIFFL